MVRELSKRTLPNNVELVEATPGISLAQLLAGVDKVILVDALMGGSTPGTVRKLRVHELLEEQINVRLVHDTGVTEAVRLAFDSKKGQLPEEILVIGVEISTKVGEEGELSSDMKAAIPEAVRLVMSELV
ncbi:MAG: hydrogenase maturation protease [archaeon]